MSSMVPTNNFTFPERPQNVPQKDKKNRMQRSHNVKMERSPDVHERSPITFPNVFG